jgi:hypothetical protein
MLTKNITCIGCQIVLTFNENLHLDSGKITTFYPTCMGFDPSYPIFINNNNNEVTIH